MDNDQTEARAQAAAGMQALQAGNGLLAQTAFTRAIEMGWPGADVWVTLSYARSLLGDMAGRIDALQKALQVDPASVRARLGLGLALEGAGRADEAASAYRQGLSDLSATTQRTSETEQLIAAAHKFLGTAEPATAQADAPNPLDDFAKAHKVGETAGDDLFQQSLDFLTGRAVPYASRPTRYFYPGLPSRQFYPQADFKWTGDFAAKTPDIRSELEALLARQAQNAAGFTPYVEANGREGTNVSHPLIDNPDWSAFYLIKQGQRIDENIALCPATMAAVDAIGDAVNPAPAPSVLFSLLKPGARIPPHHGMLNTRLICHLPIILPGQCGLRVGNETREWKDGEVFLFDDTIEHEAWNYSDKPRYVLIFEIWRPDLTDRQRRLVADLFKLGGLAGAEG